MESVITCPRCQHSQAETMPTDRCVIHYQCKSCHAILRPKPGDCCVFCSYGSVKCPSATNSSFEWAGHPPKNAPAKTLKDEILSFGDLRQLLL